MRRENQLEMKKPRRLVHAGASKSNVINDLEENVMSENSTVASSVIPFDFGKAQRR